MNALEKKRQYSNWGKTFVAIGMALILIGLGYIYFVPIVRMCPVIGCPPLTMTQIFEFYWPAYALIFVGAAFEISGVKLILASRSVITLPSETETTNQTK